MSVRDPRPRETALERLRGSIDDLVTMAGPCDCTEDGTCAPHAIATHAFRDIAALAASPAPTDDLRARVAELEAALRALLDKLDVIFADPGYQTVWTMANIHGIHYTGPDCRVEIDAARRLVPLE